MTARKRTSTTKQLARVSPTPPRQLFASITDIFPDPTNPRVHSRAQTRAIAKSIQTFGFNAPILVDKNRRIVAGHGRFEAANLLGLVEVPIVLLDHLSPIQAKAYMLADNKLTDRSTWDDRKVATHLKELQDIAVDFEIEAIGFEPPEIDFRIQSLESGDDADKADDFQSSKGPAVAILGDLWSLGPHRLYCGNSLDTTSYSAVMNAEQASAVFTDPPYNVKIDGHTGGKGRITHREFAMAAGEMTASEFTDFLSTVMEAVCARTVQGAIVYMCMDWRHMSEILVAGQSCGCELLNLCVWAKTNGGMGSLYRSRHELVFVFRNGNQPHLNNVQLGRFGRNRTNVWNYPGATGFGRKGTTRSLELHPTVKPVAMVVDAILDSTKRGDIVLDAFIGSGTTLLAAERTSRRCYGIEVDPLYVDTAIERWQRMTGLKATNAAGQTYQAAKAARGAVQ